MSESYLEIELDQQPIELYKLLKIANLVSGGGEAKVVISEGYVLLNGEVEFRKRKKVYHEDVVEFNGEVVQLIINEDLAEHFNEDDYQDEIAPSDKISAPLDTNDFIEEKGIAINTPRKKQSNEVKNNNGSMADAQQDSAVETKPKKRRPISF